MPDTTFEFGQTTQANAYFQRVPKFLPAFEHLMNLSNRVFGRTSTPKNRLEDICFTLGHTCRDDYLEIAFLSVHGHETAASKLLRGLYERALALAYMIKEPAKAERFVRFAAVQEHRAMEAALAVQSEDAFDAAMAPKTSAALIREWYQKVKPEFQSTVCKECGTTRTQASWDIDIASMARKVGSPYSDLFLPAYVIPTLNIHATLASTLHGDGKVTSPFVETFSLFIATVIFLHVLRSQDVVFSLGLDGELNACESKCIEIWGADAAFPPAV